MFRRRWVRRVLGAGLVAVVLAVLLTSASVIWAYSASVGHRHDLADAPPAPVVIVFGAQVHTPFLAGRLDATVELVNAGKAKSVLVSGNAAGSSGDETKEMTSYLVARGVPAAKIVVDPYGLDTYDTCARAVRVFDIRRALLVTQAYHLPRAVSLCRGLGMDAEGVAADCDCGALLLFVNEVREWFATVRALGDTIWPRTAD
ncbi:vancomycin high temperature exclusion protein [Kutzneria sp. 744]|uniref:SanA/YdcF family protein n=1 Tax=Kutzneria sp. (strain 744) TaxID=345341 RepID=UPI0003EEC81E|nr:ElyC/SanA/YdcF family protein [Kutzneria sp. 744]EWM10503.1 SanA protein [Kutzneria sp. 744]